MHQASLTALGLQHPPESVWSDELVPLVRAPDMELIIILVSELDRGSIRSSPRNGLSTPCRLTIRNSARLFHHILFNMGDLHVVLPALKLSNMNAGILIMMQQVRLMMFSLNTVDYSMSFLLLSTQNFFC